MAERAQSLSGCETAGSRNTSILPNYYRIGGKLVLMVYGLANLINGLRGWSIAKKQMIDTSSGML